MTMDSNPSTSASPQQATPSTGISPITLYGTRVYMLIMYSIWAAIKRETLLVLEEGIATPEEVDQIYKCVLNTPRGPCELMDIAGLDVILAVEEHYAKVRMGIPNAPRKYLREMIERGDLGVKSGNGFFKYTN